MNIYKNLQDSGLANAIKSGDVGVLPTDTTYGLVASAQIPGAAKRIHVLKGRDGKPGTLIAATVEQLAELGVKLRYLRAVEHFWPNPISVVIPIDPALSHLHQGKMSLAMRIPSNKKLLDLLEKTGPLITTSANNSGHPPATTIAQARIYFGDDVDFYVNGGEQLGEPSTIIRVIDDAIEVIRQGAVMINEETGEIK